MGLTPDNGRLVSGTPPALRAALAERVRELRGQDPLAPITVLVGTSLQRPYLARDLAARLGGHANVRILMPGDLALLLGAPALVAAGRRALPPLADRVLLADVVRAEPGYFAPVAETPGLTEALYRLVRELRERGTTSRISRHCSTVPPTRPKRRPRWRRSWRDFERRRASFYGPDDALLAADPNRLDGLGLLVWGMLDLPPALERLFGQIAERLPVDMFVPDAHPVADAPLGALRERLIARGMAVAQAAPSCEPSRRHWRRSANDCSRRRRPRRSRADDTVRLVSAPDPAREVRAAARACLPWAADGVPFWDMAVAYRHGDAYRPLVEAVFIEARHPASTCTRARRSPSARSDGRRSRCSTCYDTDLSRQSVMDFLTDARPPSELHEEFDGGPGDPLGLHLTPGRHRRRASTSGASGSRRSAASCSAAPATRTRPIGCTTGSPIPRPCPASSPTSTRGSTRHPGRAPWSEHLDYLGDLLVRYVRGADEVVEALRGLERFTALEEEVEFDASSTSSGGRSRRSAPRTCSTAGPARSPAGG